MNSFTGDKIKCWGVKIRKKYLIFKSGILIILFFVMFLFKLLTVTALTYIPPSFSSLEVEPSGTVKTCDDIIIVSGSIPDAFYPFPDQWVKYPIVDWTSGAADYLESYRITFTIKLQYWIWDILCPLGCWRDYSQTSFYHSMWVSSLRDSISGYISEIDENFYFETTLPGNAEEKTEQKMINFENINLGTFKMKDAKWRVYVTAHGETTYKFGDGYHKFPWDNCGLLCLVDTPPYDIEKEYNPGTLIEPCCSTDSDCGNDHWSGNPYCLNEDVWRGWTFYNCVNPDTNDAYCEERYTTKLYITCRKDDECTDWGDNYCRDNEIWHDRVCIYRGCTEGACHEGTQTESEMVQSCPYVCNEGKCIRCNLNTDCGIDVYIGNPFCLDNDIYQKYRVWTCNNAGTMSSSCSYSDINVKKEECGEDYCKPWTKFCFNIDDLYEKRDCYEKGCSSAVCYEQYTNTEFRFIESCDDRFVGDPYCLSDDVYINYEERACSETSGSCIVTFTGIQKLEECGSAGCENGHCRICQNECSLGQTRCNEEYLQTCGNYDGDSCMEWPATTYGSGNDNCVDCSCSCGGYNMAESIANGNCNDGKDNDCDGVIDSADSGCVQTCSDRTPYGKCSLTKPLYCYNGNLVNNCSVCGCESDYVCQLSGSCVFGTVPNWKKKFNYSLITSVTIADVDKNGDLEIFFFPYKGQVLAYNHDGTVLNGWPVNVPDFGDTYPHIDSVLATGDVNGDGYLEVAGTIFSEVHLWSRYGNILPGWPKSLGGEIWTHPVMADLNRDGKDEIIVLSEKGNIYVWDYKGNLLKGWPRLLTYEWNYFTVYYRFASTPAVGDIDDDGDLEIIIAASGDASRKKFGDVFVLNHDGTNVIGWPQKTDQYYFHSSPAVGDIDGDGKLEVVVGTRRWDINMPSKVYVWDANGNIEPGWPQPTEQAIYSSPALGDVDGDGYLEIAVGSKENKLYLWNHDGSLMSGWPKSLSDADSSPLIADMNGDNQTEVIMASNDGYLYVWNADGSITNGFPIFLGTNPNASAFYINYMTPALGDFDLDGDMDIALTVRFCPQQECSPLGWKKEAYLEVWDIPSPYNPEKVEWAMFHNDAQNTGLYKSRNISILNIFLNQGWNLISIPLNLKNNSGNYIFNNTNITIYSYKSNSWFVPNEIDNKLGYWLKLNKSMNLTLVGTEIEDKTINLNNGWNLISYPYLNEMYINESDLKNYTVFTYINNSWLGYKPNRVTFLNKLKRLTPGYGYWVKK